jgi:hypothetical protein
MEVRASRRRRPPLDQSPRPLLHEKRLAAVTSYPLSALTPTIEGAPRWINRHGSIRSTPR